MSNSVWRCKVSDGVVQYFTDKGEAEFFQKDTTEAGFSVVVHEIKMPKSAADLARLLDSEFAAYRKIATAAAAA